MQNIWLELTVLYLISIHNMGQSKKRTQNITVLIYCEGDDECECARYIRTLSSRDKNKIIKIKNGFWWSPKEIVRKAINECSWYNMAYAWIDTDRVELAEAILLAQEHDIGVIKNDSCLESEILKLRGIRINTRISWKKQYEKSHPWKPLNNIQTYQVLFPDVTIFEVSDWPLSEIYQIIN